MTPAKLIEVQADWIDILDAHDDSRGLHEPITQATWLRHAHAALIKGCPCGSARGHGKESAKRAVHDLIARTNTESGTNFTLAPQPTNKRNGYTEADYEPYVTGRLPWPHVTPLPLRVAVNMIASGAGLTMDPEVRSFLIGAYAGWARYFHNRTQRGSADGTAIVLVYNGGSDGAYAATVAICQHTKVAGPGANPQRGWHPGHCSKCGLDMSVDSSD